EGDGAVVGLAAGVGRHAGAEIDAARGGDGQGVERGIVVAEADRASRPCGPQIDGADAVALGARDVIDDDARRRRAAEGERAGAVVPQPARNYRTTPGRTPKAEGRAAPEIADPDWPAAAVPLHRQAAEEDTRSGNGNVRVGRLCAERAPAGNREQAGAVRGGVC